MENLVQLYIGEGKGKTTASMGLALRALGRGRKVLIAQFLKNGNTGELEALKRLEGVLVAPPVPIHKFTFAMTPEELAQTVEQHNRQLDLLSRLIEAERPGLAVLDELAMALHLSLADQDKAMALIQQGVQYGEVVVTGRYAPQPLMDRADYISQILKIKHPYDQGLSARQGIEF